MSGIFTPALGQRYRFIMQKGMSGPDVAALQLNISKTFAKRNIKNYTPTINGSYDEATAVAVQKFQSLYNDLEIDGVAGYYTQRKMASYISGLVRNSYNLPSGLLAGLIEGESGWYVGALSWHMKNGAYESVDVGWIQRHLVVPKDITDTLMQASYDGYLQIERVGVYLRKQHDIYLHSKAALGNTETAWKLAILSHNWPAGAATLAAGKPLSNTTEQWVVDIGVPGVSTPAAWATYYVHTKLRYVDDDAWTP